MSKRMIVREASFGTISWTYDVIKSNRASTSIVVEPDGRVFVRAPKKKTEEEINIIVVKKREWIADKLRKISEIKKPIPLVREFISGEKVLIKNKQYRIKIHGQARVRSKITFSAGVIHIYVNQVLEGPDREQEVKKILKRWFNRYARNYFSQRIQKYQALLNVDIKGLSIREQRKRWGSCTSDNHLNFNWRVIMAPVTIIDYIIVHELCHALEKTHSARFWDLVKSVLPDYEERKEWLRINGMTLKL